MSSRYARHDLIPGWDQARLADARIVVIGIGALGSEVARQLAQAGVGVLILCDGDTVEESNLSRGALFQPSDVGRPKVTAASEALGRLCPQTMVSERYRWLVCGVGLAEIRDATLVISCLDSRGARIQLAMRCGLADVGMLDGGTHPWGGEVRIYPAGQACYGCGLTHGQRAVRDDRLSCAGANPHETGAFAAVSALVASWMSAAAVRMICGLPVRAGTVRIDAANGDTHRLAHRRDPECPLHERIQPESITRTTLTNGATVEDLGTRLRGREAVLGWTELVVSGRPSSAWLSRAAPTSTLKDLGVAPREILRVISQLNGQANRYIELAAARPGGDSR